MVYVLNRSVQVHRSKNNEGYLFTSPGRSFRLSAQESSISDLVERLLQPNSSEPISETLAQDPIAAALIDKLTEVGLIVKIHPKNPTDNTTVEAPDPQLERRVAVLTNSPDYGTLNSLLAESGFEFCDSENANVFVVLSDPYDFDFLDAANRQILENERWGVFAAIHHDVLEIGPTVLPGQTACFACLEQRLAANTTTPDLARSNWVNLVHKQTDAPLRRLVQSIIIVTIHRILNGERINILLNEQLLINTKSFDLRNSPVRKLPRCPACGCIDPRRRVNK